MNIQSTDKQYIANTYARFPLTVVGGKGSVVWDDNENMYIDLATGIAVNTFGIADDTWAAAVTAQLNTLQHMSNLYYTEPCARLAEMLCQRTGMSKVFFSNSGAEANECAIKVARKYAADKKGPEYHTIITLKNSFHGRTITTLAATGQEVFHKDFLPLTEGFVHVSATCIEELECALAKYKCAAIMMEVVQGEGGVMPLEQDFVDRAVELARQRDLLVICDEVQVGNGRSGMLYGYMNYKSEWIVQPTYSHVTPSVSGLIVVGNEKGKKGLCDSDGNWILPQVFDYISIPSQGGMIAIYDKTVGWQVMQMMSK